jgi:hypothetical protein
MTPMAWLREVWEFCKAVATDYRGLMTGCGYLMFAFFA